MASRPCSKPAAAPEHEAVARCRARAMRRPGQFSERLLVELPVLVTALR